MPFELDETYESGVNIKVVGVGGGGNNAIKNMIDANVKGVEFIAMNTDRQALLKVKEARQIVIGEKSTKGLGAGANPEIGKQAALDSIDDIESALDGAHMVFITAGMGGGTGTGAAPIVAECAKKRGILTVGIVTKPFLFEGAKRMSQAEKGIIELEKFVDSLIIIPNEKLKSVSDKPITLMNAFQESDNVLCNGVRSISHLINVEGYINLDFADVTTVMKDNGYAHMGVGVASGQNKAVDAAVKAISSPLLETDISGATGLLFSITVSPDIALDDIIKAADLIHEQANKASSEADVICGINFDTELANDTMSVTLIATGFEKKGIPSAEKEIAQKLPSKVETTVKSASAQQKVKPVEEPEEDETEAAISDQDFADIMEMLKKGPEKK